MLDYSLQKRVSKLKWYNTLVQNDQFFEATKELDEILARNDSGVIVGTDDANRVDELRRIMDAIEEANPYRVPPLPEELQDQGPRHDASNCKPDPKVFDEV